MIQAAHPVKFGNAPGLVRHVLLNIIREELSGALFHRAVPLYGLRVLKQKVLERDMAVQLLRICRADVQIVELQMRLARIPKGASLPSARIPLVAHIQWTPAALQRPPGKTYPE